MEKSELIATLRKLHTELSQTDQADPETVNRLHVLTGEIQQLLERSETPPEDAGTTTHGLRELLLKFEAEHPQFAELLGRIADGLSRMGI
jgi:hypothetical protein